MTIFMINPGRQKIALLAFFILAYILPLGQRPLIEPDETRYAEIPREMTADGRWLEMRLLGLPYYEKPPLGYWLGAASLSALGLNNAAVRLPMALSALGAALTIFLLLRAQRRRTEAAWGAALIYLTFIEVFGLGTFAVLDSIFSFFITLSLAAFFQAVAGGGRSRPSWLLLSGAACAGAFLTKGFTAPVLPMLTLAVWLPWRGLLKKRLAACLLTLAIAALAAAPAALAIHEANPDFWRYFFWTEHVQRFLYPGPGQHENPFWYFAPVLLAGGLPWTFFLPQTLGAIRGRLKSGDALTSYCLAWFALPFLFFSACGGKLATYILPCFAPLAIMLAEAFFDSDRDFSLALKAAAGFFMFLILGAVIWLLFFSPPELRAELWPDFRVWLLAAAVIIAALAWLAAAPGFKDKGKKDDGRRLAALWRIALPCLGLFLASSYALPEAFVLHRAPEIIMDAAAPLTPPEAAVFTDRTTLTSAAWRLRRDDLVFAFEQGELSYGLARPAGQGRFAADGPELARLLRRELAAGRPAALITAQDVESRLEALSDLEPDMLKLTVGDFSWRLYRPSSGPKAR